MSRTLTPELVVAAYCRGVFPMADPDEGDEIYWYRPDPRAILPLDAFHIPRNLRRTVRRGTFEVTFDRAFERVMRACADRESTWISEEIVRTYALLHRAGLAHSVECWIGEELAGGLYGVALRGAFFGESMFHSVTDASKVALVHLVNRLRAGGFKLLDVQYATPHLAQFGIVEIPASEYERRLAEALAVDAKW
ncbi:MAG TPA: leucyl/phenylalanyl-tRNA--protein transferase [Rhodothermales bacterium]